MHVSVCVIALCMYVRMHVYIHIHTCKGRLLEWLTGSSKNPVVVQSMWPDGSAGLQYMSESQRSKFYYQWGNGLNSESETKKAERASFLLPCPLYRLQKKEWQVVQTEGGRSSHLQRFRLKVVLPTSNGLVKEIIPQMYKLLGFVTWRGNHVNNSHRSRLQQGGKWRHAGGAWGSGRTNQVCIWPMCMVYMYRTKNINCSGKSKLGQRR